jgi:hypothetical protein
MRLPCYHNRNMYLSLLSFGDLMRTWRGALRVGQRTFLEIAGAYTGIFLLSLGFEIFATLTAKEPGITLALGVILLIPFMAANLVLTLAVYETMHAALAGTLLPLRQALSNGMHKFFSSLWIGILQFLVGVACIVPFVIAGAVIFMLSRGGAESLSPESGMYAVATFGVLGFVLLIAMLVTSAVVGVKVQFATAALIADHSRGTQAIKASWRMTSGRLWGVIWRTVLFVIVTGVPLYIIYVGLLFVVGITTSEAQVTTLGQDLWGALLTGPMATLLVCIQAGSSMILWKDLKRAKDGERQSAVAQPAI